MCQEKTLIVAYYKFVDLPDFELRRDLLQAICEENEVKGTILLAREGINSTMAGPEAGVEAVLDFLQSDPAIGPLTVKRSWAEEPPFYRMKVRLKKEIVRLGMPEVNPNEQVGEYVPPEKWNELISDPDVVLIDTRNDYEYEIGTFKGAVDPKTKSFREFPEYVKRELADKKDKKVAMFCTGGIRCEKSTSLLLKEGFEKVYHLEGGILNYLEKVDPAESMWEGDCFVFDNRVAVDHKLQKGDYEMCRACRHALTEEDLKSEKFVEGTSCPHCFDTLSEEQRVRAAERQKQVEISKALGRKHIGATQLEREAWRELKLAERKRSNEKRAEEDAGE
ncbi:rhodanese-related sulfurtransferase [Pelagicoccus sp. SDUM812003]|uniref:oxygen-dependent tRNA uridine(34) hydroxylase TrhO n=1 Tax=Pelagicoccus sp. SDUM812003 TaxID=3041267 RepID=UPI0031F2EDF5